MIKYPDPQRSRVVLIGTSDYVWSDRLDNLPGVRGNLTGLEQALTEGPAAVFTPRYCTVVDSPDSPASFMRRLKRAADEAEDVLLVYFAGHGLLSSTGVLHLAVGETNPRQIEGYVFSPPTRMVWMCFGRVTLGGSGVLVAG